MSRKRKYTIQLGRDPRNRGDSGSMSRRAAWGLGREFSRYADWDFHVEVFEMTPGFLLDNSTLVAVFEKGKKKGEKKP